MITPSPQIADIENGEATPTQAKRDKDTHNTKQRKEN
jgi:hypothetical protein